VRYSFLFLSFLSGLGGLALSGIFPFDLLDNTDSDSLLHVSDGESTEWGIGGERFDDHLLLWDKLDNGRVTGFNKLGGLLSDLTGSSVDLVLDVVELASNMSSVAIEDWWYPFWI